MPSLGNGPPSCSELPLGLKGIVGQLIRPPRRSEDRPDRDRLAVRFEQFKKAA
jgi:putative restriction endonuclease